MVYVMWLSTPAAAGPWAKMFSLLGIWHDIHVIAQNNNSDIVFNLFYFRFSSYFSLFCFGFHQPWRRRVALRCRPAKSDRVQRVSTAKRTSWRGDGKTLLQVWEIYLRSLCGKRAIKKCQLDTCHFLFKWTRCQPDGAYFMASNRNEYGWGSLCLCLCFTSFTSLTLY